MSKHSPATPRIYLKQLEVSKHLRDFHEIWSDPANLIWSMDTERKTMDEVREWMTPRTHAHDAGVENYAIMLAVEGQPRCIGNCGVLPSGSRLMLGYGLKRTYWGEGYMSEAVPLLLRLYWARRPDVPRLHAMVNPENLPSVNILVKNGFTEQEVLPGEVNLQSKGLRDPMHYKLERHP
ncbi:hypothetical protein MMC17_008964 [Xylographa soralifera]|nr:hypothetical protein [Xylographa soralifera]